MTTVDAAPLTRLPDGFRPLRRQEFETLVDQGVYDGSHIELVGGVLVEMSPQGGRHADAIRWLTRLLVTSVGADLDVGVQTPLAVDEITLPEPDLQVIPSGRYRDAHPTQALLVIEVSMSSLDLDLGEKARRYASAGYPEYWVIDLTRACVHVHTELHVDGWSRIDQVTEGVLASTAVPAVRVPLADLLG